MNTWRRLAEWADTHPAKLWLSFASLVIAGSAAVAGCASAPVTPEPPLSAVAYGINTMCDGTTRLYVSSTGLAAVPNDPTCTEETP